MEDLFTYILEVILVQAVFFACFWLINRNNPNHSFNRYILLITLTIPFFIPFVEIPVQLNTKAALPDHVMEPFAFPTLNVLPQRTYPSTTVEQVDSGIWSVAAIVTYVSVTLLFLARLISNIFQIRKMRNSSHHRELSPGGYLLYHISSDILSFSFFKRIFLSNKYQLKPCEREVVIAHEEYHIRQRHSLDMILCEMIRIVFWFNPLIYLIHHYLKEVHEFQADGFVCTVHENEEYSRLLQSHHWKNFNLSIANPITGSSINKRLNMMKNSAQKTIWRPLTTTIIMISVLFLGACKDNLESPIANPDSFQFEFTDEDLEWEIERTLAVNKNAPAEALELYERLQRENPQYKYRLFVQPTFDDIQDEMTLEKIRDRWENLRSLEQHIDYLRFLTPQELDLRFPDKNFVNRDFKIAKGYVLIGRVDRLQEAEHRYRMSADDEIHDDYDIRARFKGGKAALTQHLSQTLAYPPEAKAQNIEEQVAFRFVVNKLGHLLYLNIDERPSVKNEDIKVDFEKAAFHAMSQTNGKWLPAEKDGKYVMSRMTMTVDFKLED